jgi:hypothetical protein
MQLLAQLPTAFCRPQLFAAHALRSCSLLDFCAAAQLLLLSYSLIFSQPFCSPFPFYALNAYLKHWLPDSLHKGGEADMRPLSLVEVNQAILAWSF